MKTPTDLNISPKHQKQLERARRRGSSDFFGIVIQQALELADAGKARGYPHIFHKSDGTFADVEREEIIESAVTDDDEINWEVFAENTELFTNSLGPAEYDQSKRVPGKFSGWTLPSQRVVNAGWMVLTYEYDGDNSADLEMQLDWFAGKADTCRFANVHNALSDYADYRGYCAVFSGNKSVHIHTLWDIRHLSKDLARSAPRSVRKLWEGDVPDGDLMGLHRVVWAEVAQKINVGLSTSITFDPRLQSYVQKRRSPGGIRRITKDIPLHGFVPGDDVEQIVLQERILSKAPAKAKSDPLITFDKSRSITHYNRDATRMPSHRAVDADQAEEIIAVLHTYLQSHGWGAYPEPVRIEFDGTNNLVFFKNNADDVHPSTLIRGDYRRLFLAGRGAPNEDVFLPSDLTLDQTLDLLFPANSGALQMQHAASRRGLPIGPNRFPMLAQDRKSARDEANLVITQNSESDGLTLVQAPEGVGKTYSLFENLMEHRWNDDSERFQSAINRGDEATPYRGFTMIACSSYEQISEKQTELLGAVNAPVSAEVLHSVSHLYKAALKGFKGARPLTTADAGEQGYSHLLQAIQARQPQVYAKMKDLRDAAWRAADGQVRFRQDAVVFLVHDLLKVWPHAYYTKAFLHPDFPDDFDDAKIQRCVEQMQPYRVIYDEVGWRDLVSVVPESEVQLAWSIRDACHDATGEEWDQSPLPDRVTAFKEGLKVAPNDDADLSFEDIDSLIRLKLQPTDRYLVDSNRFPFGKGTKEHNVYAQVHGDAYYCKALRWPRSLGCPLIILTTEDLPRLVARGINRNSGTKAKFKVINLTNTPHLFRDTVPLIFDERARVSRKPVEVESTPSGSVLDLTKELLANGFDFVISDGLAGIDKSLAGQVSSHKSARGRNDLQGQKIATILTYPAVEQYSEIAILGAAFDITNPASVAYRDTIYQDLGRNLGFRHTTGQPVSAHTVIVKPTLFKDLHQLSGQSNPDLGHDRYLFQLVAKSNS